MEKFQLYEIEDAPEKSKKVLLEIQKKWGFVPNLMKIFSESPFLLKGYVALSELFSNSSFSSDEQHIILLTVSFENTCHYCMAAHTGLAIKTGLNENIVEALRAGNSLDDPKLEALRLFTSKMVRSRGWLEENDTKSFLNAGYTKAQMLEVILGVALKTMSNYTNHIAQTPVDSLMEPFKWQTNKRQ